MFKHKMLTAVAIAILSAVCLLEAREARFWVFGSGTAQDDDKNSALSQASDAANDQINAECVGRVTSVERTGASCLGGSDGVPYTCLVFAKGLCEVHVPGR
jgi:hypothetical protein